MLFKKKRKELDSEEIKQITEEYLKIVKETIGKYLPRRERRAMSREKGGWGASKKKEEIEQIKKNGVRAWLNQTTEDVLSELSSIYRELSQPDKVPRLAPLNSGIQTCELALPVFLNHRCHNNWPHI